VYCTLLHRRHAIKPKEGTPPISQIARDATRRTQVLRDVVHVHVEDHLDARNIVVGWMETCIAFARKVRHHVHEKRVPAMMRTGLKYAADEVVIGTPRGLHVWDVTKADLYDAHDFFVFGTQNAPYHPKNYDGLQPFCILLEPSECVSMHVNGRRAVSMRRRPVLRRVVGTRRRSNHLLERLQWCPVRGSHACR